MQIHHNICSLIKHKVVTPWVGVDFTAECEYVVLEREASLLPSESAVNTHISPKDRRSLQGKVTSAVLLEIHSSSISFPLICSSYLKSPSTRYSILP